MVRCSYPCDSMPLRATAGGGARPRCKGGLASGGGGGGLGRARAECRCEDFCGVQSTRRCPYGGARRGHVPDARGVRRVGDESLPQAPWWCRAAWLPAQSELKNIVQAAISRCCWSRPPAISSHYALTLTRGEVTVQESEAVVALDPEQGIVLPPAPEDMPAGAYTVSIARAGEKPSSTVQTLQLTSEGTWRPLPWNAPGLFELSLFNADGAQVADVMLLVALPAQYPAQREAFDAMKSRTATWTGANARSDEHLFLRSFLLSGQTAGGQP